MEIEEEEKDEKEEKEEKEEKKEKEDSPKLPKSSYHHFYLIPLSCLSFSTTMILFSLASCTSQPLRSYSLRMAVLFNLHGLTPVSFMSFSTITVSFPSAV